MRNVRRYFEEMQGTTALRLYCSRPGIGRQEIDWDRPLLGQVSSAELYGDGELCLELEDEEQRANIVVTSTESTSAVACFERFLLRVDCAYSMRRVRRYFEEMQGTSALQLYYSQPGGIGQHVIDWDRPLLGQISSAELFGEKEIYLELEDEEEQANVFVMCLESTCAPAWSKRICISVNRVDSMRKMRRYFGKRQGTSALQLYARRPGVGRQEIDWDHPLLGQVSKGRRLVKRNAKKPGAFALICVDFASIAQAF